uniref:Uncharacterized protein n=1 Tax=Caenorhabditis japonica TaxID=281687 RepID=A0A8R1ICX6_CAEJA
MAISQNVAVFVPQIPRRQNAEKLSKRPLAKRPRAAKSAPNSCRSLATIRRICVLAAENDCEEDNVNSPSARLVMGALPRGGTGSFDVLLDTKMQSEREELQAERARKRGGRKVKEEQEE